jgi:phosphoribosylaminoimidazole carboxylase PurE protein
MSGNETGRVAILMGSDSDLPVMAESVRVLKKLEVPYELHVASAHRTPARTAEIVATAPERGVQLFIAGAGAAAHLAGMIAAHTTLPVLGVPLASSDLDGLDALLATAQMPAGIPVGTLAIGKAGAANAAWLAAAVLALADPALADRLQAERAAMAEKVAKKSEAAGEKLADLLG